MGIVITDISAIEVYRHDPSCVEAPFPCFAFGKRRSLVDMRPHAVEIAELDCRGFSYLSKPIHIAVPRKEMRFRSDCVAWRTCSLELPQRAMREVSHGVYLASPEVALLHYSARNDVLRTMLIGFELCGSYRIGGAGGFRRAERLVWPSDLLRFAQRHSQARGSARLARAAGLIASGSASPMESALAALLCTPCKLGGYGLPAPHMNARVDAPQKGGLSVSKRYYVADLFWPDARLIVEYDSDCWHTGSDRIAADAVRRNALLHMGFTVITVGRQQIASESKMDDIAKIVGRGLGYPVRIRVRGWRALNRELRRVFLNRGSTISPSTDLDW